MLIALALSLVLAQHYECISDESIPMPTCESTKQRVADLEAKLAAAKLATAAKQAACRLRKADEVARCLAAVPPDDEPLTGELEKARGALRRLCAR